MDLIQALRFDQRTAPPRAAFVGAGGKTTAMFHCARGFPGTVLVTATSHLAASQLELADQHVWADQMEALEESSLTGVILVTGPLAGTSGRTQGVTAENLDRLLTLADARQIPLLIEADGSRQLPLKAPAEHEPPIPHFVDTVVVVAGLSGVGRPLNAENVHRPELFAALSGTRLGDAITPSALARVLTHPSGGLKNIPAGARRLTLLNQADTPDLQALGAKMVADLLPTYAAVIVNTMNPTSNLDPPSTVRAVHEPIAAVILAAGESRRFGSPKQLLDWHGRPLIWHVIQRAIQAGLSPVIVVGGARLDQIRSAIRDLPVLLIENPEWQQGQGTSVSVGTKAVPAQSGGILFLLADQPQIPVALLRKIMAEHAQGLSPITAPLVDGQRANPILFDQVTFADLQALSGEVGGRKLFSQYPVDWVPWHDPAPLLDVDTPEDYQRLLEMEA